MRKNDILHLLSVSARLLIICMVVAGLVAAVYALTEDPIQKGEEERKEAALFAAMPGAHSYALHKETLPDISGVNAVYDMKDEAGNLLGFCVDFTGYSAYGGDIGMMISLGTDGSVRSVAVLSHSETFIDRYLDADGYYTGVQSERGSDLSAGATLSYNAIRNAMQSVLQLGLGENGSSTQEPISAELDEDKKSALLAAISGTTSYALHEETLPEVAGVHAVYDMKDEAGNLLGFCVDITGRGGYGGDVDMIISLGTDGSIRSVQVLSHAETFMDRYLDGNGYYTGVNEERGSDLSAGATLSYNAIRDAMESVARLGLGGQS